MPERRGAWLHENVQRDRQLLTDLFHHVEEQSRVVNAVREHQESIPQIASSIITPSVQAVNPSKNSKPPVGVSRGYTDHHQGRGQQ